MKTLELNQMENINAGWSWRRCAQGAMTTALGAGSVISIIGGPLGLLALAGIGCIINAL